MGGRDGAQRAAFQGHPYGLEPGGTTESLRSLSRSDLERYWERQFVTSRMLLVVVGSVTRAKIDSLVARTIGRLPAGSYRWTLPPPIPEQQAAWQVEHQNIPTNYILGYFAGPAPTAHDYFAFQVATAWVSGLLHYEVREERALAYVSGVFYLDRAMPLGELYTSTSNPGEAIRVIRESLSEHLGYSVPSLVNPPGWREFLDGFVFSELLSRSTSEGQAEALARAYLLFDDVRMADRFVERLRRVDYRATRDAVRRYMRTIRFAYMGDTTLMEGRW